MYIDIDNLKGVKKPLDPEVSGRRGARWEKVTFTLGLVEFRK